MYANVCATNFFSEILSNTEYKIKKKFKANITGYVFVCKSVVNKPVSRLVNEYSLHNLFVSLAILYRTKQVV